MTCKPLYIKLLTLLLVLAGNIEGTLMAQEYPLTLDWHSESSRTAEFGELNFQGADLDIGHDELPYFWKMYPHVGGAAEVTARLKNPTFEDFDWTPADKKALSEIGETIEINAQVGISRGQGALEVSFLPIVKSASGKFQRLVSASLILETRPLISPKTLDFAEHSKLASGAWYKFSISKDGVYKIDRSLLEDAGVDVGSLHPDDINLYGTDQGMLPLANDEQRYDDLQVKAIEIIGGDDGSFDSGDQIRFYARGPQKWEYSNTLNEFVHTKHLFSQVAYVYIGIGIEPPVRISSAVLADTPENELVTTFNDYSFHEIDDGNIVESGRRLLGEAFGLENQYSFSGGAFTFENIDLNSEVSVRVRAVARVLNGAVNDSYVINTAGNTEEFSISQSGGSIYQLLKDANAQLSFMPTSPNLSTSITFNPNGADSEGWLDFIRINCRRELTRTSAQLLFRDMESVAAGHVVKYQIDEMNSSQFIWEVTDPLNPARINYGLNGSVAEFKIGAESLREYAVYSNSNLLTPGAVGPVENQDLHGMVTPDMVIITAAPFAATAEKIADLHRAEGLDVEVILPQRIYEEFSCGMQDVTAFKMLFKMFYDRAAGDPELMLDYALLLGDGTFQNYLIDPASSIFIPTHQSLNSESLVFSYVSDDYIGFLDDSETEGGSGSSDKVDVGIGRLPVKSVAEAEGVYNKIRHYMNTETGFSNGHCQTENGITYGDWRNKILLVGDDEDGNTHMEDAEDLADRISLVNKDYNVDKVFLDAYLQESTPGGARYPEAQKDIQEAIQNGKFIVSYSGHGGEVGWAQERILDVPTIQGFTNLNAMCIMLTATCEFSRYDDPDRTSAGEFMVLNPNGGAIALLTTTRLVYSGPNLALSKNFYDVILRDNEESYTCADGSLTFELTHGMRLGDVSRLTKNCTVQSVNNLNFSLFGDPALRPNKAKHLVKTDSIVDMEGNQLAELNALQLVKVIGHIEDEGGTLLSDFNGQVEPEVYDKALDIVSLQNDGGSAFNFDLRKNIIYKGKATVQNGQFEFTFIVPKDISYQDGEGRLSYYALGDESDAKGHQEGFSVGGTNENAPEDEAGPEVNIYLESPSFVSGGLTNSSPFFFAEVFDEHGINTVGNGIGHDITVTIDGNTSESIVLNQFYESDLDSYQSGKVSYQLSNLTEGAHTLEFKVWDIYNNSSKTSIEFFVQNEAELVIQNVLNYPNPFTTNTEFMFEHNQSCEFLDVQVQVFTVSGKLVKSIHRTIGTDTEQAEPIAWDGRDDFGDRIGRGVYVYKLQVTTPDGKKEEQFEKLVILN